MAQNRWRRIFQSFHRTLEANSLDLVLGEPLFRAVVELGRARALVRGHLLRVPKRTAIRKIDGDAGGAECMTADRLGDAGSSGATPDHAPGIGLTHRLVVQD